MALRYVIMSNELMLRIAEMRPKDTSALATLPGMGAQRLENYGPTILDLVQLHPAESGDASLLQAQRTNQAETEKKVRAKVAAEDAVTVSPRVERRIFLKMQELRQKKAVSQGAKPYLIAGNAILKGIAQTAPASREDLEKIVGFRSSGLSDEVETILAIVTEELAQG
jgi:superfamily II DNA helicase RecQ